MEYQEPCSEKCLLHKYHCANCNTACSYSPANYASRPQDIPNSCMNCNKFMPESLPAQKGEVTPEFPQGKENYCPQCYFEDELTVLKTDCKHQKGEDA